ncbi:MAG TPA: carboxyl transferase domain-containing protein [Gemmatimonadaceae bacterium]|nr:carboxyl transferase domain-containing protein [Gemmatimonadaceae bacterium]
MSDESGVSETPKTSIIEIAAPLTGVVTELADVGAHVAAGAPLAVLESMKMHHEVPAPAAGTVTAVHVEVGDHVEEGQTLAAFDAGGDATIADDEPSGAHEEPETRPDLAEVLERRRRATDDAARPEAVAKRHATGLRTARENVADLCDPGSFNEYGALTLAAQRARRSEQELIEKTPGDGIVTGIGTVGGRRTAVLAYDYTVLAGTQGIRNHRKTDRLLELAERHRLPLVLFAEGGGGRPGDTDSSELFHLIVPSFHTFARLSGLVPRVGIVSGRCFAGNAALLGCCDVVIATPEASVGMGGPAMIEGGGLGSFAPDEVGPVDVQEPNGTIDVVVADEAEAVAVAQRFLSYFGEPHADWSCADQTLLRTAIPADPKRVHDARALLRTLADSDSVLELRPRFGRTVITALARIEGRPLGVIANDPSCLAGALDADGSDKAARFMQLCDAFGLPLLSLVDTPGFMVGPESEKTATVRHTSRMFLTAATLTVPLLCVIVRRAFGLGAQAMAGGSLHAPAITLAWPSGELGAMGVEGAVRLALRGELAAIEDEAEREQRVKDLVAAVRAQSTALNAATYFELDDVIDPADTRARLTQTLDATPVPPPDPATGRRRTMVDAW